MLGFNGGLMGVRRVPTSGAAPGMWSPNEQSVAKRAGIWPGEPETDPYFANVSLLLHMDGSNGSTTFTDSSSNGFTVAAVGSAAASTTVKKFGTASAEIPGAGSYLSVPYSEGLKFPGAFDVEMWFNPSAAALTGFCGLFELGAYNDGVFVRSSIGFGSDTVYVNGINLGNIAPFLTVDTWHFLQIGRSETNVVTVRVNGVVRLTGTISGVVNNGGGGMTIGRTAPGGSAEPFTGFIDEVRITKGVLRPTGVPTAPFPNA